jgi:hypothetical protein
MATLLHTEKNITKISPEDKEDIIKKIENDIKKHRKSFEMKLHIFLTMSFQILITKIQSRAEKELNKLYKNEYKEKFQELKKKIEKITKTAKKSKSSSVSSGTHTSPQASLVAPPAPPPTSSLVAPPHHSKKHNKKKKK